MCYNFSVYPRLRDTIVTTIIYWLLLAYEVIWLSMAKEDRAGPQQARECTRWRIS